MSKYIRIPYLPLCKTRVDGRWLCYCRNKGLIYAIAQIGYYKAPYEKKSVYKRGLDYVCSLYWKQYNEKLSKQEVRRLLRPDDRKNHRLIISKKTLNILECISSCVDFPINGLTHWNCMTMRNNYCKKIQRPELHCHYYLVFNLVSHLRSLEGKMDHNSDLYRIYRQIENHPKKCGK